jgi:hypothetical protein
MTNILSYFNYRYLSSTCYIKCREENCELLEVLEGS